MDRAIPLSSARNNAIDILKGIGIIFVVMGHMDPAPIGYSIVAYIYSFHMPLFFWATGYLSYGRDDRSFVSYFSRKFKSIYVPYIVFFIISTAFGHLFVRHVIGQYVIPFEAIATAKALLYSSDWLNQVPTFNFALWFLPLMFVSILMYFFIPKANIYLFSAIILAMSLAVIPFQSKLPVRPVLHINVLPMALVFMGLGHIYRHLETRVRIPNPFYTTLVVGSLCVGIWYSYSYGGHIAGIGSYLYIPAALVSIIFYYRLAIDLVSSKALSFLGKNSLIIFGIHGLVAYTYQFSPVPKYFSAAQGLFAFNLNLLYNLLVSVALCIVLVWLKRRLTDVRRTLANGFGNAFRLREPVVHPSAVPTDERRSQLS
ncbi:acyltransferase family protein [Microvirga terrestris]|uniref:Acyltransferase family protein n=1 Tax=Microvirga terrestris TaxID=2791024 RepID=A0ABS0HPN2_9HYPH|nr:acyltransferase family protein [Microvirga terrestris]MBF9195354.1 acyltransferase family protein [Microvirga terrestris]